MQNSQKCHQNVWILSGTSDGPILAEQLLKLNYVVFVSVVSFKAGVIYSKNKKLHIFTGKISDLKEIKSFISINRIDYVVDATHPFALNISRMLKDACLVISKPLLRFERENNKSSKSNSDIIADFKSIKGVELQNRNLLLAIGSRNLNEVAKYYINLGVNVYARILATPQSIINGFASSVDNSHLAILNPRNNKENKLEQLICQYWKIDYILARDSSGYTQKCWEKICSTTHIKLFLLNRPRTLDYKYIFSGYDDLGNLLKKIS